MTDCQNKEWKTTLLDQAILIKLPKKLTVLEAQDFKEKCHVILANLGNLSILKIICDFSDTAFIDSSGIGALVTNFKLAKAQNIQLVLAGVGNQVYSVLELLSLDKVLTIESEFIDRSQEKLPETHPSLNSKLKRLIDILGALVGLVIVVIIFIPIAIAIKLDSKGPILFHQIRCGWMGKGFVMWKFRSMYSNAEQMKKTVDNQMSGPLFKNDHDPRITKVGRFLRKTSLDEFPQFWNVLIGDMSLVGTRPPVPDELERYSIPQWQRLNVKPGITGEWQVNGRSNIKSFEDVIQLDLKYQENWSLSYDLKLIWRTIWVLFSKSSGAV